MSDGGLAGSTAEDVPTGVLAELQSVVTTQGDEIAELKEGMLMMASLFLVIAESCAATVDAPTAAALHVVAAQAGELVSQFG